MDPADDKEEMPTRRRSSYSPYPQVREAITQEIRRLILGERTPCPSPEDYDDNLASMQLQPQRTLDLERRAEQMSTASTETVSSESTVVIQQPSDSEEKDSTMFNVNVGGLHEQDELPHWMSQLFDKLDLEVDEDVNVVNEDILSAENIAHEEGESDLERGIHSILKNHPIMKKLNKGIHPIILALHVLMEEEDEEEEEEVIHEEEDIDKVIAELDDYLSCHTYHTIEEGLAGIASGFQNPPPCPYFQNHTCEKASISSKEDTRSNENYPESYRVPEEFYAHIDKKARDHWKSKKRISYEEQVENGMKWMGEECLNAFRKYAEELNFKDNEYKFGELLNQCFSVDGYTKNFHHFNFTIKEKPKNSDIWNSQLYFAEVKQLAGVKYYFCCLLGSSDNGKCNGCHNQKMEDLIKHPATGGYEKGDAKICWPFLDDTSYLSGSDDDDDF
uniref:DUF3615 domain-containing protein n=1 Tax=Leersia perrieri TaxID=77586 RepID=A0A0D9XNS2_9ORYZ